MPAPSQPYVDNPCWGGPQLQQHNLSYLLELISSGKFNIDASNREETIILHNDNDYLVIDKVSVTCNFALVFRKLLLIHYTATRPPNGWELSSKCTQIGYLLVPTAIPYPVNF